MGSPRLFRAGGGRSDLDTVFPEDQLAGAALDTAPAGPSVVSLVDVDAEFAAAVPAADLRLARQALAVAVVTAAPDEPITCPATGRFSALIVLDGALWRETRLGRSCAPELLGPGTVLEADAASGGSLPAGPTVAMTAARLAVIDERFLSAAARWPALAALLHGRSAEQHAALAGQAAICQIRSVDDRLVAFLWHLAQRWGRVKADGVHLPLRLTHETLGRFIGAQRPTVSLALKQLCERGVVRRGNDGSWILSGEGPAIVDGTPQRGPRNLFPPAHAAVAPHDDARRGRPSSANDAATRRLV